MHNYEEEIKRCLNCLNKPCKQACPLGNDIPRIVVLMKEDKLREAYEVLSETTVLPAICSKICPHDKQCKKNCTLKFKGQALNVGDIEFLLAEVANKNDWKLPMLDNSLKNRKIAVIGSGPSGLTAAAFLARYGADVSIFEKREKLGGVLMYGIPEFRLEKDFLQNTLERLIRDLNIKVFLNQKYGEDINYEFLNENYDAIFFGMGANKSKMMGIPGEELNGVYGGNELLEYDSHPDYTNKVVYVSGGGNVAVDTARVIKRRGAKRVTIVYRRSETEMPADIKEIEEAKKDGVEFVFNTNVVKILGDTKVEKIECVKTKYNEEKQLINVEKSNFELAADCFVMSIGSIVDNTSFTNGEVEINKFGKVLIDENMKTSSEKIFAAGNLVSDNSSAAMAARSGRDAAEKIKSFLVEKY
ncbi:MAG: FAD-dependent oxidoreductase [Clostridia bacterium]|nr:FAD-dependent oxidoreductase [Clostridia bacterium]